MGFVGALLKIARATEPTHIFAIFDGEHENDRTDIDPNYKANRPDYSMLPEEDASFPLLPDIYKELDYRIEHIETANCETDDLVAGYALAHYDTFEIVISSFDGDIFQLVTEKVSVLRYRGATIEGIRYA